MRLLRMGLLCVLLMSATSVLAYQYVFPESKDSVAKGNSTFHFEIREADSSIYGWAKVFYNRETRDDKIQVVVVAPGGAQVVNKTGRKSVQFGFVAPNAGEYYLYILADEKTDYRAGIDVKPPDRK